MCNTCVIKKDMEIRGRILLLHIIIYMYMRVGIYEYKYLLQINWF